MGGISYIIDVEVAHHIASAYLEGRAASIEARRNEYVDKEYQRRMKQWFGKPKSRDALREELKETDEWYSISLNGKYQADRMADLVVACAAAMRSGIQAITLGGDTANVVSWEIMLNALEGKEENA